MSYVYAITDGTYIKIGVAQKPPTRLKQLSTGSAKRLVILGWFDGGFTKEAELHKRFNKVRDNGEWFHPTPELIDFLNEQIEDKFIVLENDSVRYYLKIKNINS